MTVYRNGDLPEGEGAGIDIVKHVLILVLDSVFEGADGLCICNFDWEYLASIIAIYPAVELECGRHEVLSS